VEDDSYKDQQEGASMFRFQSDSQAMSLFAFHDGLEHDPRALVLKAVGVAGLGLSDVGLSQVPGPMLSAYATLWQRWELKSGAPDAVVPPCLGEDPDDLAYPVRSGLVVTVSGSPTAYVVCGGPGEDLDEPGLTGRLSRFAEHPFYAPVGSGASSAIVWRPK